MSIVNDFYGSLGDREDLKLRVIGVYHADEESPPYKVYYFMNDEGYKFFWKSTSMRLLEKNKIYKIKGTIDKHVENNKGEKVTKITRCSLPRLTPS